MSLRTARQTLRHTLLVALLLPLALSAQQPPAPPAAPAGKGIIRGVVTAADTGRPILRASVELRSVDVTPFIGRTVATDEKGRYEITGLIGGRYTLTARKPGYLTLAYGQIRARDSARPVEVSESLPLDKVDFPLPRGSVIVARIVDRFGDPVRDVNVRVYVSRFTEGRRQLGPGGGSSTATDDRGETRIFGLAPGEYYLGASPDLPTHWRGELETLYPGTTQISEAQLVRIGIGQEALVTFPMLRSRAASLSGRIIGSNGAPLGAATVSLEQPRIGGGGSRRMSVAADGSFSERYLAPGNYTIVVTDPEYGAARVQLAGDDIQGLIITTSSAATVRGRVTFEGAPPPTAPAELNVAFDGPRTLVAGAGSVRVGGRVSSTITAPPDKEWTFEAQVSGAGVLRARTAAAGPWILKAVLLGGKDVTDTPLDFGTAYAGKPVEVVLTQRRGQLNGSVSNDRGQPVSDYVLVLFPEDDAQWTAYSRFIATTRPDQQGRFTINNLPPGRYLAAAVETFETGEERNPETLARLRGSATAVALTEGESRSLTLRLSR